MGRKKKQDDHIQLSAPYAYVTAAESLFIARKWALERKDTNALIDIANSWTEIGNQLLTAEVELVYDEDDETVSLSSETEPPFAIGFTGGHNGTEKEAEPSAEPTKDKR